jgi:hypothetical protein
MPRAPRAVQQEAAEDEVVHPERHRAQVEHLVIPPQDFRGRHENPANDSQPPVEGDHDAPMCDSMRIRSVRKSYRNFAGRGI